MTTLACMSQLKELSWSDKIAYLAYKFKPVEATLPPIEHRFEDGWYIRVFRLPAGIVFIGRSHNQGHICKLIQGKLGIMHELGTKYYEAPSSLHTKPGYQMVLYSMTEILAETRHPNPDNGRNIDQLENEIFGSVEAVLEHGRIIAARMDYEQLLQQHNLTQETVNALMVEAYIDGTVDVGQDKVVIRESAISGKGCYSLVAMGTGDTIAVASVGLSGTPAGRYTNHSPEPNAECTKIGKTTYFIALRPVAAGEEITVNYRQVLGAVG